MHKKLAFIGLVAATVFFGGIIGGPSGSTANAGPGTDVGLDVDPSGNTATSLGTIDRCKAVNPGDLFQVDVFVTDIPAGRDLGGFQYAIGFGNAWATVASQDHSLLIASTGLANVQDWSEAVPDGETPHLVGVFDYGDAEPGAVSGVLGRYALEIPLTAPVGVYSLDLANVVLGDEAGDPIPVSRVLDGDAVPDHGLIAVGQACPGDQDGDGVSDHIDNCRSLPNANQADADGDGDGDICDNCPSTPNADQANFDGDPLGDACDGDDDNDGLADGSDPCPIDVDCDDDGSGDFRELRMVTDISDSCPNISTHDAWPYDTTKNKKVDVNDLLGATASFKNSFGSRQGDVGYNARLDFDASGTININDLLGAGKSFKTSFGTACGNGMMQIDQTGDGTFELTSSENFHSSFDDTYSISTSAWRVEVTSANSTAISFRMTCPGADLQEFSVPFSGGTQTRTCANGSTAKVTIS